MDDYSQQGLQHYRICFGGKEQRMPMWPTCYLSVFCISILEVRERRLIGNACERDIDCGCTYEPLGEEVLLDEAGMQCQFKVREYS